VASNAINRLFQQRKENVRVAETEMKRAHDARELKAAERTWIPVHGCSNRNRSSTGNDAGRGATAKGGAGSGVDEPLTREEDDVVAAVDGAGAKGSKATAGRRRRRRRRGTGRQQRRGKRKKTGRNPRPASAALTSGWKGPEEVAVGSKAAAASISVDSVDVESCCDEVSDSSSVVKKVVAGLVLLFVVAMLALSGSGLLRCISSSSAGEAGGMSVPIASSYAAAGGSQVVKAERAGVDTPALPAVGPATLFGGSEKNDTAAFESEFGGEAVGRSTRAQTGTRAWPIHTPWSMPRPPVPKTSHLRAKMSHQRATRVAATAWIRTAIRRWKSTALLGRAPRRSSFPSQALLPWDRQIRMRLRVRW
jgi:hypothetical protein